MGAFRYQEQSGGRKNYHSGRILQAKLPVVLEELGSCNTNDVLEEREISKSIFNHFIAFALGMNHVKSKRGRSLQICKGLSVGESTPPEASSALLDNNTTSKSHHNSIKTTSIDRTLSHSHQSSKSSIFPSKSQLFSICKLSVYPSMS